MLHARASLAAHREKVPGSNVKDNMILERFSIRRCTMNTIEYTNTNGKFNYFPSFSSSQHLKITRFQKDPIEENTYKILFNAVIFEYPIVSSILQAFSNTLLIADLSYEYYLIIPSFSVSI